MELEEAVSKKLFNEFEEIVDDAGKNKAVDVKHPVLLLIEGGLLVVEVEEGGTMIN